MKKFVVMAILFSFNVAHALEPAISITPSRIEEKLAPLGEIYGNLTFFAGGGDEPVELTIEVDDSLRDVLSFDQYSFVLNPNETRTLNYKISAKYVKRSYVGKVRISSGEQVTWVDFSINVSMGLGRFIIEAFSDKELVRNFTVRIYKGGTLVERGESDKGYYFSGYLDYGEYMVILQNPDYEDGRKAVKLESSERYLRFNLTPIPQKSFFTIPREVILQLCEGEEARALVTLRNEGREPLSVRLSYDEDVFNFSVREIEMETGSSYGLPFSVMPLPPGSYEEEINFSFDGEVSELKVSLEVLPSSECEGREVFSGVEHPRNLILHPQFPRYVPIYVNVSNYMGSMIISKQGGTSFEAHPRAYKEVGPGEELVFLIKFFEPKDEIFYVQIQSNKGVAQLPIQISTSDTLTEDAMMEEIDELEGFFSFLRWRAMNLAVQGKDVSNAFFSINTALIYLEQAREAMNSDRAKAKEYVDLAASQTDAILEDLYQEALHPFPYHVIILMLMLLLPLSIYVLRHFRVKKEI